MSPSKLKFREEALAHLYADKSYDTQLKIVSSQSWLLLVILSLGIISILLWGIFGSIPIWVEGKGIILTKESNIYSVVAEGTDGEILEILVSPQQKVMKNQPIAKIGHSALERETEETEELLAYLITHHAEQQEEYKKRYEQRKKDHESQKKLLPVPR